MSDSVKNEITIIGRCMGDLEGADVFHVTITREQLEKFERWSRLIRHNKEIRSVDFAPSDCGVVNIMNFFSPDMVLDADYDCSHKEDYEDGTVTIEPEEEPDEFRIGNLECVITGDYVYWRFSSKYGSAFETAEVQPLYLDFMRELFDGEPDQNKEPGRKLNV